MGGGMDVADWTSGAGGRFRRILQAAGPTSLNVPGFDDDMVFNSGGY